MKKIIAIISMLLLVLMILIGCDSNTIESSNKPDLQQSEDNQFKECEEKSEEIEKATCFTDYAIQFQNYDICDNNLEGKNKAYC